MSAVATRQSVTGTGRTQVCHTVWIAGDIGDFRGPWRMIPQRPLPAQLGRRYRLEAVPPDAKSLETPPAPLSQPGSSFFHKLACFRHPGSLGGSVGPA